MNEKFLNLPEDKQMRLLEAICNEFAMHSYEEASTNEIVKNAGISKGTLFNYFGSKENLYLQTITYVLDFFEGQMITQFKSDCFIERNRELMEQDFKLSEEYPHLLNFATRIITANPADLPPVIATRMQDLLVKSLEHLYIDLDMTLFKENIDREFALKAIKYLFDGYLNALMREIAAGKASREPLDVADMVVQHEKLLKNVKKLFYKE